MKKILYLLLLSCSCFTQLTAQTVFGKGIEQPAPSVSSLGAYSQTPVSIQTGIPNISYNIFKVPTRNKNVNVNLELSYHANNVSLDQWIGDLGKGWSLMGRCAITRENYDDIDEKYKNATIHYYKKNLYDDVYSFSTLEETGKFRIKRDTLANTFKLIKLTPFKSKVNFTRADDGSNLIFGSFTITSGTGIKYEYNVYNTATTNVYLFSTHDNTASGVLFKNIYEDIRYRSVFYLSSIKDENENVLVNYEYIKEIKFHPGTSLVKAEYNRLSKIAIASKGSINIDYSDSGENNNFDNKTDRYFINSFTLKDTSEKQIGRYGLEYAPFRALTSLKRYGQDNQLVETIAFKYNSLLHMVQLPTKGTIVYDYESEPYYKSVTDSIVTREELTNNLGSASFTTFGTARKILFNNPKYQKVAVMLPSASLAGIPWGLTISRKEGTQYVIKANAGPAIDPDPGYPEIMYFDLPAGEYYGVLSTYILPRPDISFGIDISASEFETVQDTIKVTHQSQEQVFRIKNIKKYNDTWDNIETKQPVSVTNYDYSDFNTGQISRKTLEEGVYQYKENEVRPYSTITLYNNVKVSDETGYEKYYFKTGEDYAVNDYAPFYELVRGGLLEKKEIYSKDNILKYSEAYIYGFGEFNQEPYAYSPASYYGSLQVKPSYVSEITQKTKTYLNGKYAESTLKKIMGFISDEEISPNAIVKQEEKLTDGTFIETSYQYAKQKGNQLLVDKNFIEMPLDIEKKINGKIVSKAIAEYPTQSNYPTNQAGYLLQPLSAKSTDMQNYAVVHNIMSYDKYDYSGNLLQYTDKDGTVTSLIWGYKNSLLIAKVQGATYDQVLPYITNIVNKSNEDKDSISEQAFQSELFTFRFNPALIEFQITTYVHDPLTGVKIIMPPNGIKQFNIYDQAGRLKEVREDDSVGNILKEYNYNYKP